MGCAGATYRPFSCGGRKALTAALLLLPCVAELAAPLRAAFCNPGAACSLAALLSGALRLKVGGSPARMLQHSASWKAPRTICADSSSSSSSSPQNQVLCK